MTRLHSTALISPSRAESNKPLKKAVAEKAVTAFLLPVHKERLEENLASLRLGSAKFSIRRFREESRMFLYKRQGCKSSANEKHATRFPFWRERGTSLRLGESRIHYVNQKEWQQYDTPCLFIKRLFAESIPCNFKGVAPTRPSDVKALTRES